jgi:OOP family OmpA-OmpF porin
MISRFTSKTLVILAALATCSAHAEGLYVGGSLGLPDYSGSINGVATGSGGTGLKIYGGAALNKNFALEGGLFDLGKSSSSAGTVKGHGLYLDGVGTYELAPQWSLLGRVGLAEGRFSTSLGNGSSPALKFGAGVQYDLTRQVSLRLEYERYHFVNLFDGKPNVGQTTFGVKVGF